MEAQIIAFSTLGMALQVQEKALASINKNMGRMLMLACRASIIELLELGCRSGRQLMKQECRGKWKEKREVKEEEYKEEYKDSRWRGYLLCMDKFFYTKFLK